MYQIGDRVVYSSHGVCQIVDMEEQLVSRKKIRYYVLQPLNQSGSRFYVPAENPAALAKLRPVLDREELEQLLGSNAIQQDCWIDDENQRKQRYRELIISSERLELLKMIHTLHLHKKQQMEMGRKMHLCDENFLRDAEKLLNAEFALVLGIQPSEVESYILTAMK